MLLRLVNATRLSREEWGVFARAWLLLPAVDAALRVVSFRKVESLLAGGPLRARRTGSVSEERMHRLVAVAAELHVWPIRCLRRALVLQWLLRRSGVQTTLQFGVRKAGTDLQAHAWLEREGSPIGEFQDELGTYRALGRSGTARPAA